MNTHLQQFLLEINKLNYIALSLKFINGPVPSNWIMG